ncbi:MAG TPA: DUF3943 domain-containing protein [Candidatus Aminicenantes bacterium]|nr:DUF3943 domain-containing protein [Candidatus Aminicenantes bacterium]HRY63839.1 DUF3943 domain-containing protein [Candidatus Aminicenantes bacterium]HRZ70752.1 DUF3943 domain-containing protein [Candidatus Aminicenantes bacterium]
MGGRTRRIAAILLAGSSIVILGEVLTAAELGAPIPEPRFSLVQASRADADADPVPFSLAAPAVSQAHKKRPGRAWIELGAFLTYSTTSYWTRAAFPEDWQFQLNVHDQFERVVLLKGWRFDSNNFKLNWSHVLAGGVYYQFARSNNLTWLESWLMAVAASTYWETVVEWKEVISLNDQITTGLGSFSTGEPWYQVGHYLTHQPGLLARVLSFVNPAVRFNHWLDRKKPGARDYAPPGWRDLAVFIGGRSLSRAGEPARTSLDFGLRAQLLWPSDYGRTGDVRRSLKDVHFAGITLDYAVRNGRADETGFSTSAVTLGSFRQKIAAGPAGFSLIMGLGTSFEYFKKRPFDTYDCAPVPVKQGYDLHLERPRAFTDKLALVHLAGPVVDWTVFRPGLRLRTVAEAYFDFGLINAWALNAYSELHHTPPDDTIAGMKTTVTYYGYYYGFGGTFSGRTRLEWGDFRAQASVGFGAWGSAEALDRFQGEITNNAHLSDGRFRWLAGAGWRVPGTSFEIYARYEVIRRRGRVLEVRAHGLEKRLFAGVEFSF